MHPLQNCLPLKVYCGGVGDARWSVEGHPPWTLSFLVVRDKSCSLSSGIDRGFFLHLSIGLDAESQGWEKGHHMFQAVLVGPLGTWVIGSSSPNWRDQELGEDGHLLVADLDLAKGDASDLDLFV